MRYGLRGRNDEESDAMAIALLAGAFPECPAVHGQSVPPSYQSPRENVVGMTCSKVIPHDP